MPDYIDICPNTPKGVLVDEFGCPLDADNDGIPDYLDRCANTPIGVQVGKYGCPLDSDGDGVPDYLDKCPNTPRNEQVDEFGCPIKKQEIIKEVPVVKEIVLSAGASFGVGSSVLLPGAYGDLDKLAQTMLEEKTSKWLIEGHTDNAGSAANNKKLSLKRANAVVSYLVSKGISKNRFTVRGMGPDYPVADNRTEEGRAKNRRVVILRVN
ncbi:MAG: OmpA family protein [Ignavibacteriaceae bacterium]|nr:OmpA family protein [Ignavibacteriaceae bacterium]